MPGAAGAVAATVVDAVRGGGRGLTAVAGAEPPESLCSHITMPIAAATTIGSISAAIASRPARRRSRARPSPAAPARAGALPAAWRAVAGDAVAGGGLHDGGGGRRGGRRGRHAAGRGIDAEPVLGRLTHGQQ